MPQSARKVAIPTKQTDLFRKAQRHLTRRDPILKRIIATVGPCTLQPTTDYFAILVRSIVSQMISTKAAISISGLVRGDVVFAGPIDGAPRNSRIVQCQAPLQDSESPGANPARLPADIEAAGPISR